MNSESLRTEQPLTSRTATDLSFLQQAWHDIRAVLPLFLVLRLLTAVIAFWAFTSRPPQIDWSTQPVYNLHDIAFTTPEPLRAWLEPWYRWDTGWYVFIAYSGYAANPDSIIFPPLYPAAMSLFAPLAGGDYLLAGLIVSNLACLAAMALLHRLVKQEFDAPTARTTLLLFMIYPAAFYMLAAYTESLYIALTLGAWLAVTHKRYWLAGLLAFFAALTRSQGWTLGVPFAWMIFVEPQGGLLPAIQYYLRHPLRVIRPLPALVGGFIGTLTYIFGMRFAGLGSVEARFDSAQWQTALVPPYESLMNAAQSILAGPASNPHFASDLVNFLSLILILVLGVMMIRRLKPQYWLFVFITLLFILLRQHEVIQLHGILRYVLSMFPVFIMLAILLRGNLPATRIARMTYLAVCGSAQIIMLLLFTWWGWVS